MEFKARTRTTAIIGAALAIFAIGACWSVNAVAAPPSSSGWGYQKDNDKMSGETRAIAHILSANSLNLAAPYQGENHATLYFRRTKSSGLDLVLNVDKGQLMCRSYSPCKILVRFDENKPVTFEGGGASDHSTNIAFIQNANKFMTLAQRAKRIYISMAIYQNGNPVMEFNTPTPLDAAQLKLP